MALPRTGNLASRGLRLLAHTEVRRCLLSAAPRATPLRTSSTNLLAANASVSSAARRPFSQTSSLLKKRKIAPASNSPSPSSSSSSSKAGNASSPSQQQQQQQPDPQNPLDLSSLTAAYAPIDAHFKSQLQAVLHGGRFSPDSLGALLVAVKSPEGGGAATHPLRELAQVVPRPGRTVSLLVNDRAYVKPIMSAVQASGDFNQQPQRAEDNELELLLRAEMERRDELVRRVRDACQGWRERVRQARTRHEKLLKDWRKSGAVLPDVVKKAEKELQKLQDKKMKEIDQDEAQTIKQLDRN